MLWPSPHSWSLLHNPQYSRMRCQVSINTSEVGPRCSSSNSGFLFFKVTSTISRPIHVQMTNLPHNKAATRDLRIRDGPIVVLVSAYRHYFTVSVSAARYCGYFRQYLNTIIYGGILQNKVLRDKHRCKSHLTDEMFTDVVIGFCSSLPQNVWKHYGKHHCPVKFDHLMLFQSLQSARSSILVSVISAKGSISISAKMWYRPIPAQNCNSWQTRVGSRKSRSWGNPRSIEAEATPFQRLKSQSHIF